MHDFEKRRIIYDIEAMFKAGHEFVKPGRTFLRQGVFHKVGRRNDVEYTFFLFNDLLVYASGSKGSYNAHNQLDIDFNFHIRETKKTQYQNAFDINSSVKSFTV